MTLPGCASVNGQSGAHKAKVMVTRVDMQRGAGAIKQKDALDNARGALKQWDFNDIMGAVACVSY